MKYVVVREIQVPAPYVTDGRLETVLPVPEVGGRIVAVFEWNAPGRNQQGSFTALVELPDS